MSDIDRVFARLGGGQTGTGTQRELRRIAPKGGAATRVVEVVRLPAGTAAGAAPRRTDVRVRAATWDDGFPARSVAPPLPDPPAAPEEPREAVAHVMPAWTRTVAEPAAEPPVPPDAAAPATPGAAPRPPRTARAGARRVADPFDAEDDGANCLRCGYAVEAARERRGLLTCASCG